MPVSLPSTQTLFISLLAIFTLQVTLTTIMRYTWTVPTFFLATTATTSPTPEPLVVNDDGSSNSQNSSENASNTSSGTCTAYNSSIDLGWHAPLKNQVNNLANVINGTGVYGFIFDSSQGPPDKYNWCNMPHANTQTYTRVASDYKLEYVEVIQRHHKRTPYASNTFPREGYSWNCDDEGLFYGGEPINPYGNASSNTYWSVYTSPSNPLAPQGFNGTCQFPQITRGGLDDSHQHGVDLKTVYHDLHGLLPAAYDPALVSYRVTNNVITSQVASMLIAGMWPERAHQDTPLLIQPSSIDSLEPKYSCPAASSLFGSYGSGSSAPGWRQHLDLSASLYARLDALSGVSPSDGGWHASFDHYFDNLSARLCHAKALPCNIVNTTNCVTQSEADAVFRRGEYEYSYIYRDAPQSLRASTASYGIWIAELAQNLRDATTQRSPDGPSPSEIKAARYRHNVAHDGSISRLLSILQIERMVWPGMGSEIVFELYSRKNRSCWYVRVLWGGQTLISSHPSLGRMTLVPLETLLSYFDGLVGRGASKIPGLCSA